MWPLYDRMYVVVCHSSVIFHCLWMIARNVVFLLLKSYEERCNERRWFYVLRVCWDYHDVIIIPLFPLSIHLILSHIIITLNGWCSWILFVGMLFIEYVWEKNLPRCWKIKKIPQIIPVFSFQTPYSHTWTSFEPSHLRFFHVSFYNWEVIKIFERSSWQLGLGKRKETSSASNSSTQIYFSFTTSKPFQETLAM